MTARKNSRPPARAALLKVVNAALSEMKAHAVTVLDVRNVTDVTDAMIIASGTSDRHVRSIADRVVERAKQAGFRPFGLEGEGDGEKRPERLEAICGQKFSDFVCLLRRVNRNNRPLAFNHPNSDAVFQEPELLKALRHFEWSLTPRRILEQDFTTVRINSDVLF